MTLPFGRILIHPQRKAAHESNRSGDQQEDAAGSIGICISETALKINSLAFRRKMIRLPNCSAHHVWLNRNRSSCSLIGFGKPIGLEKLSVKESTPRLIL
jgi:hypothetical protein